MLMERDDVLYVQKMLSHYWLGVRVSVTFNGYTDTSFNQIYEVLKIDRSMLIQTTFSCQIFSLFILYCYIITFTGAVSVEQNFASYTLTWNNHEELKLLYHNV
jgi:hypothetical protein